VGWIFEGYVHAWFRKRESFIADKLLVEDHNTTPFKFTIGKLESISLNYFMHATRDLAK